MRLLFTHTCIAHCIIDSLQSARKYRLRIHTCTALGTVDNLQPAQKHACFSHPIARGAIDRWLSARDVATYWFYSVQLVPLAVFKYIQKALISGSRGWSRGLTRGKNAVQLSSSRLVLRVGSKPDRSKTRNEQTRKSKIYILLNFYY